MPEAFPIAATLPPVLALALGAAPADAADAELAFPLTDPLPSPVSAPFTPVLALDDGEEPIAAVALPDEPKDPVAVLPPLAEPVMPPLLCELLPTAPELLSTDAVERSAAWPETDPLPGPEIPPLRPAVALAEKPEEPEIAALPEAPNEAVPPPVVWPEPVAAVWAEALLALFDAVDVSLAWACDVPGPDADALVLALAVATPPTDGAADAEPLPAPDAEALPLACAFDDV